MLVGKRIHVITFVLNFIYIRETDRRVGRLLYVGNYYHLTIQFILYFIFEFKRRQSDVH